MKLDNLRPWDTSVDPLGRVPLKPFERVEQLTAGCREIFCKVNATLGSQFEQMMENGLLDLASRKGKAPGGYQSMLQESRKPFIFMNAVGVDGDVRTLLHESGHAFHSLACAHDPLVEYRHGPMEFNEVASMGMELLADRYLNVFYPSEEEQRSSRKHFEDIIFTLVWVATIDAFQHWIYQNPQHDHQERRLMWLQISKRFSGGIVDWSGLEEEQAHLWHKQLHIFEVPFYYIEYGIAQLGALQLWLNSKKDWDRTLQQYQNGLRLGGSKPLPELFEAAGIRFDFSEKTIVPLMKAVEQELHLTYDNGEGV
jgi:oligoendopeptidase F